MNKSALVLINGDVPSRDLLLRLSQDTDLFLCTDGAANLLLQYGLEPDAVIGDLDSLSEEAREHFSEILIEVPSQYATDFEKALEHCKNHAVTPANLVGLKGGRLAHAYTNFSILSKYAEHFQLTIFDEEGDGAVLSSAYNTCEITCQTNQLISLLPVPKATGIVTKGLKYPLTSETLELGVRDGLSNVAEEDTVRISIKSGVLIVFKLLPNLAP
jgi:thiamine pyrophosphokinase